MKKILHTILLVLLFTTIQAQSGGYYSIISKQEYDSLIQNSWYPGRLFLTDGTYLDGTLHRNFTTPTLEVKFPDGSIKSYNGFRCAAFYMINHKNDTASFIFLNLNDNEYNPKFKALRLLIDGKPNNGISLLRYAWVSAEDSWGAALFHSDVYQINWEYYIWKDGKIRKLSIFKRDLKSLIEDKPQALQYYNEHKRELKQNEYTIMSNIIHIYNLEKP